MELCSKTHPSFFFYRLIPHCNSQCHQFPLPLPLMQKSSRTALFYWMCLNIPKVGIFWYLNIPKWTQKFRINTIHSLWAMIPDLQKWNKNQTNHFITQNYSKITSVPFNPIWKLHFHYWPHHNHTKWDL